MKPVFYHSDFFKYWNQIKENSIDLILTDPPYGILTDIQKWDIIPPIKEMESIFNTILKPTGQVIIFSDLTFLIKLYSTFTHHFQFRFNLIWEKTGGMPISEQRPIPNTEFILVFRKKGIREKDLCWNPYEMGEKGEPYIKRNYDKEIPIRKKRKQEYNTNKNGWRYPKTIIKAENKPNMNKSERTKHPTQKPEILLRKLIRCFSNPEETILDPFSGSGSTLVSAFKENRYSLGFEIDKNYYTEAKQRINNITSQEILL